VAHDFNNLLAVISGTLDLSRDAIARGDPGALQLLEPARRAAERGSTLTRSLLSFSRQQPLRPQTVDLNLLVRDLADLLRRTLPSNIAVEFTGGERLWPCELDPGELQNALLNLAINSRDAMPDGGRLSISASNVRIEKSSAETGALLPGDYVALTVQDTGMGMAPEVIERAFEPFFTTKGMAEGTGLGLSMVYGFAMQSGGHVSIASTVGRGTRVRLYLPRPSARQQEIAADNEDAKQAGQSETVLVVEDDADMRYITVSMLRSLGFKVLEASSGPQALDVLSTHGNVSLLVTDVVLSGSMNGRRVAQEATRRRPELKVLYMSGYSEDVIVHNGRLDPGVHFIQKPFRKQDLGIKTRQALCD
jgi:CheY-like chemotaxis protein